MIVCGPSGAGKTTFVRRITDDTDQLCNVGFKQIIYAYGIFQPLYRDIAKDARVQMVEGMPGLDELQPSSDEMLLVLDDLFLETNKDTAALFTRMRHLNMSTVFVTHNFFHECKYMCTVIRNAHYLVFFRCPRDVSQLSHLSRQMFPGKHKFLPDALMQATANRAYGYLFIDFKPDCQEAMRVRSDVMPDEDLVIYCPT